MQKNYFLTKLGEITNDLMEQSFPEKNVYLFKIIKDWHLIVDEEIYKFSEPERLSFSKGNLNNGTLHIAVLNGSYALKLAYMQDVIVENLSIYFGFRLVSSIKFTKKKIML